MGIKAITQLNDTLNIYSIKAIKYLYDSLNGKIREGKMDKQLTMGGILKVEGKAKSTSQDTGRILLYDAERDGDLRGQTLYHYVGGGMEVVKRGRNG